MGDRYTITERVDQGGMAEVFRGVAESIQGFKKAVAIKRILPSLTRNRKFVSMFLDEAKLSLYLQHANIVQVFDIGQSENSYFLVMEYVNGCNLKHLLERVKQRGRRVETAQAIYLMIEACKGLNYAHSLENPETLEPLNIVHRDISPPNILISKNGEVKLVDFGLAKANSQLESTDPGVVKGKFSYLSPEAASGLEVDHRADIFAVGILLWEMLTNRRLFLGDTDYQTVELVRQARIPSMAALNPDIEPELEAVARKALARDPNQRYQNAGDLGDALAQYLFSRRMKVTARDIAALVRDAQLERQRQRSLEPQQSLIDVLIQDEMAKLTSLLDGDSPAVQSAAEGATSLDPSSFVDTSSWASDFGFEGEEDSAAGSWRGSSTGSASGSRRLSAAGSDLSLAASGSNHRLPSSASSRGIPAATTAEGPEGGGEIEALSQLLEPERTGVHPQAASRRVIVALVVIAILLAGAIGVGLVMFKDRLFGGHAPSPTSQTSSIVASRVIRPGQRPPRTDL